MVAQRLASNGYSVVVIDRRDICTGSTSASTALLQYDIDVTLVEMAKTIGSEQAEAAYKISHRSIDDLAKLAEVVGGDCSFTRKKSIFLAADRTKAKLLANEARARKAIGLSVVYHDEQSVMDEFGLRGVAALSSDQAACCDPYRFAHALLKNTTANGGRIFDRTRVTKFHCDDQGVRLESDRGPAIVARHAVIAMGYESQSMLHEKVVNLDNTYAIVSQPLNSVSPWNADWMMWEAKNPYLYMRITSENRLLVGGEDDEFHSPVRRDASLAKKAVAIEAKVRNLIPDLQWETEFAWAGTFGKTKDGLAYIGKTDEYPNCYFALGFGGNGITYSSIAANIISDLVAGKPNRDAALFRFGR